MCGEKYTATQEMVDKIPISPGSFMKKICKCENKKNEEMDAWSMISWRNKVEFYDYSSKIKKFRGRPFITEFELDEDDSFCRDDVCILNFKGLRSDAIEINNMENQHLGIAFNWVEKSILGMERYDGDELIDGSLPDYPHGLVPTKNTIDQLVKISKRIK
jgi:hypothetical protein